MKPPFPITLACLAVVLHVASTSAADPSPLVQQAGYNYGDIETARTLSMGGAARALGGANSALYANPANMAMTRVYHLEALAHVWPEPRRQTYGVNVVDSMTSRVAVGLGANYAILDPDGLNRKWTDARLAIAFPFTEKIAAGLTGRYLKLNEYGVGRLSMPASYASAGRPGEPLLETFSFDAGLVLRPTEGLYIGAVGSNLSNPGNGLLPTSLSGGVGYGTSDFSVEGDILFDTTTFLKTDNTTRTTLRAMLGAEYLAADHYPLRIGYRYDDGLKTHELGAGLGYIDAQFGLEFGLRRTLSGPDNATPMTALVFELEYYLEGSGTVRSPEGSLE